MIKKAVWIATAMSLVGLVSVSPARADEWNKQTRLTFSQPVEIPGRVLAAGTYTFKLADSMTDRHIVEIWDADQTKKIATVMTIPNYRLKTTDQTVIRFNEVPAGDPEAIRAWFYPGNALGQEFVYPRKRAAMLAKYSKTAVPALAVELTSDDVLKTAPIVAITPDEREVAVAAAIQTVPDTTGTPQAAATSDTAGRTLPGTASDLSRIALFGLAAIALGLAGLMFGRRTVASVR